MSEPMMSAAHVAEFDQAYALAGEILDKILEAHRQNLQRIAADDIPEAMAIGALTRYLLDDCPKDTVCAALTAAVVRIDRALKEAGR